LARAGYFGGDSAKIKAIRPAAKARQAFEIAEKWSAGTGSAKRGF